MHLLCDAIKIFEELSLEKLEQDINKFYEKKKVKDVSIKIQQKSQKGYMICDRVGDGMDIYNVYLATIRYERDITQERVDEDVEKVDFREGQQEIRKSSNWTSENFQYGNSSADERSRPHSRVCGQTPGF